jgi:iron complex transport system substrate-binding protein
MCSLIAQRTAARPGARLTTAIIFNTLTVLAIAWVFGTASATDVPAASLTTTRYVIDDDGQRLALPQQLTRIVSLSPGATAMLFAAGAGAYIVGTAGFSDEPVAAKSIPRIGDSQGYDIERIIALRPQLIASWGSGINAATLERLRKTGVPIYNHHLSKLSEIPDAILRLGNIANTQAPARLASDELRARIARLRSANSATATSRSALIQVWDRPVYTVGGAQLLSDAVNYCGYRNAYADLRDAAPAVTVESVLARNPSVIIAVAPDQRQATDWLARWQQFSTLQAVRDGRLLAVVDQRFSRLGPSVVDASAELCTRLNRPAIQPVGH